MSYRPRPAGAHNGDVFGQGQEWRPWLQGEVDYSREPRTHSLGHLHTVVGGRAGRICSLRNAQGCKASSTPEYPRMEPVMGGAKRY